jgi:hypothetical protein
MSPNRPLQIGQRLASSRRCREELRIFASVQRRLDSSCSRTRYSQSAGPIGSETKRTGLLPQSCAGKLPISKSVGRLIRRVITPCLRAHGCAVRRSRWMAVDRKDLQDLWGGKRRTASRRGPGGGDDGKAVRVADIRRAPGRENAAGLLDAKLGPANRRFN